MEIKTKNGFAIIEVSPKIYSLYTIYSAAYVFLDRCYIILDENSNNNKISIYIKPKGNENPEVVAMEFYNELINYGKYFSTIKENFELSKMIVQRALFSADPSIAQEMEEKEIKELIKQLEEEEMNNVDNKNE